MTSPSRRDFVAMLLGAPVAAALACRAAPRGLPPGVLVDTGRRRGHAAVRDGTIPVVPADRWRRARVVVVGAGAAGLAAAWALRRRGIADVRVVELDAVIGGTARGDDGPVTPAPWGAHYVVAPQAHQAELTALLAEMDAIEGWSGDGAPIVAEALRCRDPEERVFHRGRWYPGLYLAAGATADDHAQYARFQAEIDRWAAWRDAGGRRAFALPSAGCSDAAEPTALDRISFAAWLDARALRSERLRWLCDYACRDDYGLTAAGASAWAGLFYFAARIAGPGAEPQTVVTWPDGNHALIEALARGAAIETGIAVVDVRAAATGGGAEVVAVGPDGVLGIRADQVIVASPRHVARRIVAALRGRDERPIDTAPWAVANLHLRGRPRERAGDAAPAWDNVLRESPSLGYVSATHQRGRDVGPTVWTWYYPFTDLDAGATRRRLDGAGRDEWAEVALADLTRAHPDLPALVDRIDVAFWGHGMPRPTVGALWDGSRAARAAPIGPIHFAHTDLSGLALFEEAFDHGLRAAGAVTAALGWRGMNRGPWVWSRRTDLIVFVGTAAVALALVPLGRALGASAGDSPEWTWITGVLLVDVAHVWSTAFVVYLDPVELRRRRALYVLTPIACWLAGLGLYQLGELTFWRAIAYLAIFHFVRQQWGWVAMYRGRAGERDRLGRAIDAAAIYAATIYPLIVWHCRLPRAFAWMIDGDLAGGLPARIADVAGVTYLAILAAYVAAAIAAARRGAINWGKHALVATTAACWYVGIVATNSDYAFTVTNVFIHGVPYLVLVYGYARAAAVEAPRGPSARVLAGGVIAFVATLWVVAYAEELVWDRNVWHDRPWLFGAAPDAGPGLRAFLVPLLAVPQLAHYVLDGFLWRRATNPRLSRLLG